MAVDRVSTADRDHKSSLNFSCSSHSICFFSFCSRSLSNSGRLSSASGLSKSMRDQPNACRLTLCATGTVQYTYIREEYEVHKI